MGEDKPVRIIAVICLTLLCILGRFVLRWRRLARSGFGTGLRTNVPRVVRYDGGNALVWFFGQVAFWGAAAAILLISAWYWSLLAVFLAGGLERPLLVFLCRGDLETTLEFRRKHKELFDDLRRLEGRDPFDDALR